MTPQEFQAALDRLGMTARSFARISGRNPSTVANWTRQGTPIPEDVAKWLKRRMRDLERDPPPGAPKAEAEE